MTIVVGDGVIGLSTAYQLASSGAEVTVIGTSTVSASNAAAGILFPNNVERSSDFLGEINFEAVRLWNDWVPGKGLLKPTGLLQLTSKENDLSDFNSMKQNYNAANFESEFINLTGATPDISGLSGKLKQYVTRALWTPDVDNINPIELMKSLQAACLVSDVKFVNEKAIDLLHDGKRAYGVTTNTASNYYGDYVIAACGYKCNKWLPDHLKPEIIPEQGESIRVKLNKSLRNTPILGTDNGSIVPRENEIFLGASKRVDDSEEPLAGDVSRILTNGIAWLPEIAEGRIIEINTGIRPTSARGLPYIGITDMQGLLHNTGHGTMGVLSSPFSAKLISEIVNNHGIQPEKYKKLQSKQT